MTEQEEQRLVQLPKKETQARGEFRVKLELDLGSTLALCGNLQLALRHPLNAGSAARIAREIVDDIRTGLENSGFPANAELLKLGDDPAHDYDPREKRQHSHISIVTEP